MAAYVYACHFDFVHPLNWVVTRFCRYGVKPRAAVRLSLTGNRSKTISEQFDQNVNFGQFVQRGQVGR